MNIERKLFLRYKGLAVSGWHKVLKHFLQNLQVHATGCYLEISVCLEMFDWLDKFFLSVFKCERV